MKNIAKTLLLLGFLPAIFACEDFLTVDPQDSLVAENYYISEARVRANTASLYGKAWWDFQSQFMWLTGDQLAGDLYYTYDAEGQFYYNSVGAGNTFNNSGWNGLYRVVSFANSIINDMPGPSRDNGISEDVIQKALGEAHFMRGVAYYYIAENWGEAPIIENATDLITSDNPQDIYVNKNTQSNLYRFICEDLEFAASVLPAEDPDPGRVTKWSALGMLAKVYITRGAYESSSEYFTKAKEYARQVIEDSGLELYSDYSTMFDVVADNSDESLFSIQCMVGEYGDGNSRNVNWSRSARIADQTWGAGKGPTISLQQLYEEHPNDDRRKWVYMTNGDYYPNLAVDEGGYTYQFSYRDPDDLETQVESPNEMLAHIKKYIIGKASDNGGQVGQNQDAANDVYILRLSDVYFLYAEATMGLNNETSDSKALEFINQVLARGNAGYEVEAPLSYLDLLKERRKEFAFEGSSWYDIKRYYYRDPDAALQYLNDMERDRVYRFDYNTYNLDEVSIEERYELENSRDSYVFGWETTENGEWDGERVENISFSHASMYLSLPAEVTTKAPILLEPAVNYYNE
ncbi:RagB/SusD family nutrient uptake outer membrane protein [Thermophagus sp. OGC60D27]|uniref:RagB/SusD family nutrient uptake outer membrane protein n=1 Tax=Thermophagus sp. OGC60D27 TaxID=3458415 RepID=UPI004037CF05